MMNTGNHWKCGWYWPGRVGRFFASPPSGFIRGMSFERERQPKCVAEKSKAATSSAKTMKYSLPSLSFVPVRTSYDLRMKVIQTIRIAPAGTKSRARVPM